MQGEDKEREYESGATPSYPLTRLTVSLSGMKSSFRVTILNFTERGKENGAYLEDGDLSATYLCPALQLPPASLFLS